MNHLIRYSKFSFSFLPTTNLTASTSSKRSLVSFKDIFRKKDKNLDKKVQDAGELNAFATTDVVSKDSEQNSKQHSDDYEAIRSIKNIRLTRVKAYKPPENAPESIRNICTSILGKETAHENFENFQLDDLALKHKILMKCIEIFKHDIPNPVLNDIKDIGDLVEYYLTEVKDESPLELIANQPKANLPQNLHINLEYTRFDPETDKFFDGKDAFANRNTIVSSLWYSKKYKPVFKKKPIFEK